MDIIRIAILVLMVAVPAAGLFIWGRGIRRSRKSDLIAGPGIFAALCLVATGFVNGAWLVGPLFVLFGIGTIGLSFLARPGGKLSRLAVILIGVATTVIGLGLYLLMVMDFAY